MSEQLAVGLLDTSGLTDLEKFEPAHTSPNLGYLVNDAAYGRVYAAVLNSHRRPRGRLAYLLIAATAVVERLPLLTRNAADFAGLDDLIRVVEF